MSTDASNPFPLTNQKKGVRSYVLRQGRMSSGQKRALAEHYADFVIAEEQITSLAQQFPQQQPIVCSIGFGMGEALAEQALKHPELNFFGIEVHAPGVGALIEKIVEHDLTNIRIAHKDVTTVIAALADKSIDIWQIFFPDPWHKKRHHKRRLIQVPFLKALYDKTVPNGKVHIATDWAHYAEHCVEILEQAPYWQNTLDTSVASFPYLAKDACYDLREETKYERRGKRLGHTIFDLYFKAQQVSS